MSNVIQAKAKDEPSMPTVSIFLISLAPRPHDETSSKISTIAPSATYIKLPPTLGTISFSSEFIEKQLSLFELSQPPSAVVYPRTSFVLTISVLLKASSVSKCKTRKTTKRIS